MPHLSIWILWLSLTVWWQWALQSGLQHDRTTFALQIQLAQLTVQVIACSSATERRKQGPRSQFRVSMDDYAFYLYSNDCSRKYEAGDHVFVWLRSNRSTGRAVVLQTPDALPCDSQFAGRYQVEFLSTGQTAHVRPERLFPVFTESQLILVTAATEDYRRLARSQVTSNDVVLELGCSYGMCTNMLAEHAAAVIGIDNSAEVVAEARRRYPHARFEIADVLNEPAAVMDIACSSSSSSSSNCSQNSTDSTQGDNSSSSYQRCNVVFADIGGNRQLEALLRLIPWVLQHLQPRLLVVKSEELAESAAKQVEQQQEQYRSLPQQYKGQMQQQQQSRQCEELAEAAARQLQQQQYGALPQEHTGQMQQQLQQQQRQCLVHEQGRSQQQAQQWTTNQVQQLQEHLLSAAVLTEQIADCSSQSNNRCTCSEASCGYSSSAASAPAQIPNLQQHEQQQLVTHQAAASLPNITAEQILNPKAWWDQLEVHCGLNPLLHAGRAEPWFVQARAKGFVKNPLRYPQRFTVDGTRICRPHNYDRCFKIEEGCMFDHVHCHHCGVAGHRAVDCPVVA